MPIYIFKYTKALWVFGMCYSSCQPPWWYINIQYDVLFCLSTTCLYPIAWNHLVGKQMDLGGIPHFRNHWYKFTFSKGSVEPTGNESKCHRWTPNEMSQTNHPTHRVTMVQTSPSTPKHVQHIYRCSQTPKCNMTLLPWFPRNPIATSQTHPTGEHLTAFYPTNFL